MKIFTELKKKSSRRKKQDSERFFKIGKGTYSEGDIFVGISMPALREIAQTFVDVKESELKKLITSKFHEYRMCGFLILTYRYKQANRLERKRIYKMYTNNLKYVNNWDIVDVTTPNIIGEYIKENKAERKKIELLSRSRNLWKRRVSVLSCFPLVRVGEFTMFLRIAKTLLSDKEDLIHKAVGWILREVYKRDKRVVKSFIDKNYKNIPRTTLRYAIEKMEKKEQKSVLDRKYRI